MKVSIIITLYNRMELCLKLLFKLQAQIEAKNAQNDIQVIILDDGSTEEKEYLPAIKSFCAKSGFIYKHQKNGGEAKARNAGKDLATGEYFTYIDCDDDITPEYLDDILSEANYGYDLVAFKWIYKDSGEDGCWHDRPLVNWNVWSYIFKTDVFKPEKFDEKRIVASDYFFLANVVQSYMRIGYAENKRTIIYNANNPQNLTNRFGRGEVEANRKD